MEMEVVRMTPDHVPGAMTLKELAGWNQLPQDWSGYMALAPTGCFAGVLDGRVVATGTAIDYGREVGWIGMILVHPEFRRRGMATRMMNRLLDHLSALGCRTLKLDATDAGAQVYEKLGFVVEYGVERWSRVPGKLSVARSSESRPNPVDSASMAELGRWDGRYFGVDRSELLEWLRVHGGPSWFLGDPGKPEGLLFGRPGSFAHQLGPLTAANSAAAEVLLALAVEQYQQRTLIADLISGNNEARRLLRKYGFLPSRVLKRMYRGQNDDPGRPDHLYCLAGFEFG